MLDSERVDVVESDDVAQLYAEQRASLLRLAFLLTGDRGLAEDLVQDAFLSLHRRWADLSDRSRMPAYLRTAVVNGARSAHRRRLRRHPVLLEPQESGAADDGVLLAEEHRTVLAAVRRLPRRQQEVMVLRYWAGLSEAEIAESLGVSRGTVKTCASRALATLTHHLGDPDVR
ncbi:SigE family RNA polymerase sigma factor [Blastococcus sp. TF02-8]|uniref:SigE family RNA polymerase sigma factor n=1 Tax=Blastococcus sp. TF02-8 TaxID=2250574 RepID=UPI000DE8566E|nr:SigE family RNA polymerase sigma factor [Blastococcus sp. TF02-8]RBY93567.1 SigE family RNA polymerase sigma factor [Blastococcus sp. TF02-8]